MYLCSGAAGCCIRGSALLLGSHLLSALDQGHQQVVMRERGCLAILAVFLQDICAVRYPVWGPKVDCLGNVEACMQSSIQS